MPKKILKTAKFSLIFLAIFSLISCSYRPIFDKNEKFTAVGEEKANEDFKICKKESEDYLDKYKTEQAAKESGRNAVIGGAIGAGSGAIWGRGARSIASGGLIGLGVGAAVGAISVIGADKIKPDQIKQRYVAGCLNKKGYSILGWI